jgi:hypothetical protein
VQHTPTPTRSQTPPATAHRLAWLALGLLATAFAVFEVARHGRGPLVLTLTFALAPDLPMLIGAKRTLARGRLAPAAVPFYNLAHRVWGPLVLLVACTFWIDSAALFTGGLAWLAHIAIDRATDFGLRTRQEFQRG